MKTPDRLLEFSRLAVIPLLLLLVLAACGAEATMTVAPTAPVAVVQVATDTPLPPTDTPAPPTDTPAAPTDTPVPPTVTPVPPTETPAPTETTRPTDTPVPPTDTPIPPTLTDTPEPTIAPTEAASPTPAPTATATPKPKPKAGKILLTSNRVSWDDVFVMNDDGTEMQQLTTMGKCYDAHFTPNGATIFFEHDDDIWKMNADGSGQVNLSNTPDKLEAFPVVAPDGTRVAYLFGWLGGFEIYTMKVDGTDAKSITSENIDWMPAWSPDSQKIAFSSLRGGSFNIWVVNRDGSDVRQVTPFGPERVAFTPVFSPNGQQIAFSTIDRYTAWEIWVVNVDGSNPHKVVGAVGRDQNNSANIVAWHSGKFLIAGWEGNWEPYYVPESGGQPVKVLSGTMDDKPSDWWLP